MRTLVDAEWAFRRYGEIRHRLPFATFPGRSQRISDLEDIVDNYDLFIFDSFGVLNVGDKPIPGAVERVAWLRQRGKRVCVLTNAASIPPDKTPEKYASLGFDFSVSEIVSSRAVLAASLSAFDPEMIWTVIAPENASVSDIPCKTKLFDDDPNDDCDGYIFLSSAGWTPERQSLLTEALRRRQRHVLIGNPDLVAPREHVLTREPGSYAHDLDDALGTSSIYFGKPFGNAFDFALENVAVGSLRHRTLMIGDTLHTDILGGRAAGMDTVLVTGWGVLKDMDVARCIEDSHIVPTYIAHSI